MLLYIIIVIHDWKHQPMIIIRGYVKYENIKFLCSDNTEDIENGSLLFVTVMST
jgi:hypothetical protein